MKQAQYCAYSTIIKITFKSDSADNENRVQILV